jgi:hypothetical protein
MIRIFRRDRLPVVLVDVLHNILLFVLIGILQLRMQGLEVKIKSLNREQKLVYISYKTNCLGP